MSPPDLRDRLLARPAPPPVAPAPPPIPAAVLSQLPRLQRFAPFTRRQRLLIAVMAVTATTGILGSMLVAHVDYLRAKLALGRAEVPRCAAGQTEGCVGGTMGVIVMPPAAPASR